MADLYCSQTFFSTLYQIYFKIQGTEPPLIFHFYLTWAKYLSEFSLITSCPQSVCLSVNFSHFHFLLQNHRTSLKLGTNYFWVQLLYPTQLVAEGIMFLTRPSVSQYLSFWKLKKWIKISCGYTHLHMMSFIITTFLEILLSGFRGSVLTNCFSSIVHFGQISKFKKGVTPREIIESKFPLEMSIYTLCPS